MIGSISTFLSFVMLISLQTRALSKRLFRWVFYVAYERCSLPFMDCVSPTKLVLTCMQIPPQTKNPETDPPHRRVDDTRTSNIPSGDPS
jgi:hypothetical protein